jgi:hypothetical protein
MTATVALSGFVAGIQFIPNQLPDPTLASGTLGAEHQPRLR